jgi:hypothetical protein
MIRTGVPKTSSHFTGWPLAEAVKRTTGSKNPNGKDSQFWTIVERGELAIFGRRTIQSEHEWIPAATFTSLVNRDLKTSSASGKNAKDQRFLDILIYPVLHAPNAIDFLDNKSLKDAFWEFVLHDPEVLFLGNKAIKADPDLTQVYREGRRQRGAGWEWPFEFFQGELAGGRSKESPIGFLADPLPQEVQLAADTVCDRYSALLALLRQQKLEAEGDSVRSRGSDRIPSSIWSHRSYYFDAMNGDVLQKNENPKGWHDIWLKRWRAVILQAPFHVEPLKSDEIPLPTTEYASARSDDKLTPNQASIDLAVEALWPNGSHVAVPVKIRDKMINDWQRVNHFAVASARTIDRHLKKKN